jgi:hypothetical protein
MNPVARKLTRAEAMQKKYTCRKIIFDALLAGTATPKQWQQLRNHLIRSVESGCLLEMRANGEFVIYPGWSNEQEIAKHDQDVGMTNAPTTKSSILCISRNSLPSSKCYVNWPSDAARLPHLQYRLQFGDKAKTASPTRFRAFFAIKFWTGSAFGNSSSPSHTSSMLET